MLAWVGKGRGLHGKGNGEGVRVRGRWEGVLGCREKRGEREGERERFNI